MEMEELEKKLSELYNRINETKEVSAVDMAEVNMIYKEIEERYLAARKLRDIIHDYNTAQINSILAVKMENEGGEKWKHQK